METIDQKNRRTATGSETAQERSRKSSRRRNLPSPALAVSVLALIVALSGTAVALPGKATVNSGDIRNNTVKTVDLKDGKAVKTDDVVDASLTGDDVAAESLGADDLAPDSAASSEIAANAVTSSELATGAVTSSAIANGEVRSSDLGPMALRTRGHTIPANSSGGAFANCPAGETRISGGVVIPAGNNRGLQSTWPNGANGWTNIVRNNTGADLAVTAYVLCLQG